MLSCVQSTPMMMTMISNLTIFEASLIGGALSVTYIRLIVCMVVHWCRNENIANTPSQCKLLLISFSFEDYIEWTTDIECRLVKLLA